MLDRSTRVHIERELDQLYRLQDDYKELLQIRSEDGPELFGRTALSSVVQAFYQGVEGVFQTIAKRIDGEIPSTADWHQQLLRQMANETESRPPVITQQLLERLEPFLGFRHLARHTYPFLLNWIRMRHLVEEMGDVLRIFHEEIKIFLKNMEPPNNDDDDDDGS